MVAWDFREGEMTKQILQILFRVGETIRSEGVGMDVCPHGLCKTKSKSYCEM